MTVYTKSMMESLAEVRGLQEDNMDLMRKAAGGSMQTIKMKDGKLKMDSFTASAMMQVYDKVNDKNKKAMEQIINSGKRAQMVKLQAIAMKAIKSENDPELDEETELDEALEQYVVIAGPGDNKQKIIDIFKGAGAALNKAKKVRDDWNKKNKNKIKLDKNKKPIAAHMARIVKLATSASVDGVKIKTGDDISWSMFNRKFVKEEIEEEVDLEEGRMKELHGYIAQGKSAEWIAKKMGVDVKTIKALMDGYGEVDEASARTDAMRAMRRGKEVDPADVDTDASDADVKAASKNILAQMRKAVSLGGRFDVEFLDKKKVRVKPAIANAFVKKYEGMRKPADKEKFQNQAMKSYKDMLKVLKAGYHEEVELDEAKYELYHKDFSSAMQHAYKMAKKLHGITVKSSEIDDKVASGPRKPSEGKTNTYRLKGDKGAIQVQVYNKGGSKPYELNFYKEEVELDEALPSHLKKHFDKDGNPKSKEGKAAWERLAKMKGFKKYTSQQIKMAIGIAFDKRYVQGNMTGAVNAIEKIAKGLSEIEPVRNALQRANEEVVNEGTWAIPKTPKQKRELKKLLSKPLKAKDATDKLYDIIGDDTLFDDIGDFAETEPNADVRSMVRTAMKRLGIKEETILDRIDRKLKERKNG